MTIIFHATQLHRLPKDTILRSGLYLGQFIGTSEGDAIVTKLEIVEAAERIEASRMSDEKRLILSLEQVQVPSWSSDWLFYGFRKLDEALDQNSYILFPIMARSIAEAIEAFAKARRLIDGVVVCFKSANDNRPSLTFDNLTSLCHGLLQD